MRELTRWPGRQPYKSSSVLLGGNKFWVCLLRNCEESKGKHGHLGTCLRGICPPSHPDGLSRKEEVTLARLRGGHSKHLAAYHGMVQESDKICPWCRVEKEDLGYFLQRCEATEGRRLLAMGTLPHHSWFFLGIRRWWCHFAGHLESHDSSSCVCTSCCSNNNNNDNDDDDNDDNDNNDDDGKF